MTIYQLDDRRVVTPSDGRYWVAPTASVMGNVRIDQDASIWFGAVLRGDNELIHLCERVNIQDGSVLHTDPGFPMTLHADVTVGHMAMLHGCTVEAGSLIGIGAIVLNGARIGAGSLVGAHSLIPEGKVIPPRSLVVGAPGRVVRQLKDEEVERLLRTAANYVRNSQGYAKGLKPQT
ncbi:MAG: gamma carbonic anhydrase family protein [Hyphomicrobiaceae bacterium]